MFPNFALGRYKSAWESCPTKYAARRLNFLVLDNQTDCLVYSLRQCSCLVPFQLTQALSHWDNRPGEKSPGLSFFNLCIILQKHEKIKLLKHPQICSLPIYFETRYLPPRRKYREARLAPGPAHAVGTSP